MKTKRTFKLFGAGLLLTMIAQSNVAVAGYDGRLLGGWNLTDFVMISPEGKETTFCKDMSGIILYEKSGHMSVSINCGVQSEKVPADDYGNQLFYAGTFTVSGDEVSHKITNTSAPSLMGKVLVRKVSKLNDRVLVLTGKFGTKGESLRIAWKKEVEEKKADAPVAYLTRLKLKEGKEKEFLKEVKTIIEFSRSEPGNIAWFVQQSKKDPTEIVFYTRWINQGAIDYHLSAEPLVKYIQRSAKLLAQPAELTSYNPLDI
jgi:quinol monooxygenase YgiN